MSIAPGSRIGSYEVAAAIGAGGMGEVYRARDTRLNRDVALKILPDAFASDPERLARFEREAQVLASLNHPHIAQIYGIEDGPAEAGHYVRALVLEFVDGETLADRIARGPIPLGEARPIARQIAEALEAAHEQGIIHRDLKPANIKLRSDGTVKVLDFGLAKLADPAAATAPDAPALSMSPTITSPALMTNAGVVLGTAAYMSPEQARGKPADKRSDIWAFGCVLFEMLAGTRAFDGEDATDTIAAVVRSEPRWAALPREVPPPVRLLLQQCLEKDRRQRVGDISTALFVLRQPTLTTPSADEAPVAIASRRSSWKRIAGYALAVVVASAATAAAVWISMKPDAARVWHLGLPTSGAATVARFVPGQHVTMTPDGRHIVYVGGSPTNATSNLYTRALDANDAVRVAENVQNPFVRFDGSAIGFISRDRLFRVAITGGPSVEIARISGGLRGATWGPDDTIVFATSAPDSGLLRVAAGGGEPTVLTRPDPKQGGMDHIWPRFLPGGRAVLFTITRTLTNAADRGADYSGTSQIALLDLTTPQAAPKILVRGGADARYVSSGHLVYLSAGSLRAVAFDLRALEVTNPTPVPVLDSLNTIYGSLGGDFDIAADGTLVYVPMSPSGVADRTLTWVDRRGREQPIPARPQAYLYPRLSPDGTRVAVDVRQEELDIWVWDLARQGFTRVTKDPDLDRTPVWSDSEHIVFSSMREGTANLFRQRADGTGTPQRLTPFGTAGQFPVSMGPDGTLLFVQATAGGSATGDLMTLRLDAPSAPTASTERTVTKPDASGKPPSAEPLVQTPDGEINGTISPDGRWLAYQSNESGQWDIYVAPLSGLRVAGMRATVSTDGGTQPRWSHDGSELFYVSPRNEMMSVTIGAGSSWSAPSPVKLFDASAYLLDGANIPYLMYDVAKDGRFLMVKPVTRTTADTTAADYLGVVLNFHEHLKRLVR